MIVGRFDAADGSKTYRPFHRLPDGSWAMGDPPGLLPIYRLPEIVGEDGASICEGEKCADALDSIDFIATTSAHGAKSPEKTDWTPLAGKDVAIMPDNDKPGEGYATALLRIFKRLDPRPTVRIIRLSGLGDGEDVANWLSRVMAGRSGEDAVEHARTEYAQLWNAAPVVDLDTIEDAANEAPRPVSVASEIEGPIPIPAWPDPPEDAAFHELAGMIVKLIEPSTEADPVAVLLQLLIGFGNAVGRGTWVVADGHFHYANEFAVCVGDTSRARKGTSWRRVRPVLAHADPGWADSRITGGLSSGEGLIHEIRDAVFGVDDNGDPVCKDQGVDDKRVLVVESEFGNVLRVLAREGNTLSAVVRMAWDSDDLRTMTKHSQTRATNPHVSLIGHITQQELLKYLSSVEVFNGLGNRILWACVKRSKRLPFGGSCDQAQLDPMANVLAAAVNQAKTLGPMEWSSSGRRAWEDAYADLTEDRPGLWGAITARAEAHVLRLALIFTLLDMGTEIEDAHVRAAIALWRYCDRSAAHLFGGAVGDRDADAILAALRVSPGGMTRTEINVGVFNRNRTSEAITRALGLLQRYRLARCEPAGEGRPERWFAVSPSGTATNCTNSTN